MRVTAKGAGFANMDKLIRIVICTRHTLLREGIKALLTRGGPIEIAGEAVTTAEAVALLTRVIPDVILMDPCAPDLSGSEATRLMKAACPHVKVLVLALDADASVIADCILAGASAYIGNYDEPRHLRIAIRGVCGKKARAA